MLLFHQFTGAKLTNPALFSEFEKSNLTSEHICFGVGSDCNLPGHPFFAEQILFWRDEPTKPKTLRYFWFVHPEAAPVRIGVEEGEIHGKTTDELTNAFSETGVKLSDFGFARDYWQKYTNEFANLKPDLLSGTQLTIGLNQNIWFQPKKSILLDTFGSSDSEASRNADVLNQVNFLMLRYKSARDYKYWLDVELPPFDSKFFRVHVGMKASFGDKLESVSSEISHLGGQLSSLVRLLQEK